MSLYLDASLLVAALSKEVASRRVQTWLGGQSQSDLAISDWVVTEVASALAMKVRTRAMASDEHDAALTAFAELTRSLEIRPVSRGAFRGGGEALRFASAGAAIGRRSAPGALPGSRRHALHARPQVRLRGDRLRPSRALGVRPDL